MSVTNDRLKRVEWPQTCKETLSKWPPVVKGKIGHHLFLNQGGQPSCYTNTFTGGHGMSSENNATFEIAVNGNGAAYRLVFAAFRDRIYVLHAFTKSTEKTPTTIVGIIARRHAEARKAIQAAVAAEKHELRRLPQRPRKSDRQKLLVKER